MLQFKWEERSAWLQSSASGLNSARGKLCFSLLCCAVVCCTTNSAVAVAAVTAAMHNRGKSVYLNQQWSEGALRPVLRTTQCGDAQLILHLTSDCLPPLLSCLIGEPHRERERDKLLSSCLFRLFLVNHCNLYLYASPVWIGAIYCYAPNISAFLHHLITLSA